MLTGGEGGRDTREQGPRFSPLLPSFQSRSYVASLIHIVLLIPFYLVLTHRLIESIPIFKMTTYSDSVGEVDIIFAGGGTAACVAAGRLAKANPDLKILLVEGGANNFENPTVVNPAVYLSHLAPDSKSALVRPPCLSLLMFRRAFPLSRSDAFQVLQIQSIEAPWWTRSHCPYGRNTGWWLIDQFHDVHPSPRRRLRQLEHRGLDREGHAPSVQQV